MKFDWDEEKSQCNKEDPDRQKSFAEAVVLWTGEYRKHPVNVNSLEQVYIISGEIDGKIRGAFVVERGDETRIISFRRLNKRERVRYGWEKN